MATDRRRHTVLLSLLVVFLITQITAKSGVIDLNEDNWPQMLEGEWMVEFFAPWCPACKALKPIWTEFASWSDDLGISVGQVDVTASPGLSGRFMVTALPTIYHVKDGVFRQYRGSRDKDEFMSFIEERRWEDLEEVPAWKSPASLQMSIVAQFFKLSMVLRSMHSVMVESYGLPDWGSYTVFAMATILIGAVLGMVLVCIIDVLFPPKAPGVTSVVTAAGIKADDEEEDLVEDADYKEHTTEASPAAAQEERLSQGERSGAEEEEGEDKEATSEKEDSQAEEDHDSQGAEQESQEESQEEEEEGQEAGGDTQHSKSSPDVRRRKPRRD